MTQKDALDILKTGKNVFVTGPAGSGKTFVVNEYIRYLKSHHVPIGITASTGIAATHMGGMTIHSWSGINIKNALSHEEVAEIAGKSYIKKKIKDAKVLIIDEVSMLHHFRLDMVDKVLKHVKNSKKPFGGIQVVLCGDFFQLPPVSRFGEPKPEFVYKSKSWEEADFTICYLSENYRQQDDPAVNILNEMRSGEVSEPSRELLMSRYSRAFSRDDEDIDSVLNADDDMETTKLFTHNVDVDSLNEAALENVDAPEFTFEMSSKGRKPLVDTLKKSCLAPEVLKLRKGARVMCVKNNFDKGYVNGTLGVVVSCVYGSDPIIRTAPSPDYPNGRTLTIEKDIWLIDDNGKSLAEIHQYPLRLAWAITVHKSQGMSLDSVEVDLSKSFEPGMGYVALSRVRTLRGLKILGLNENALAVNREVLEHDKSLQEASKKAERIFINYDSKELEYLQKEFLASIAPLHHIVEKKKKVSKNKKTHAFFRERGW